MHITNRKLTVEEAQDLLEKKTASLIKPKPEKSVVHESEFLEILSHSGFSFEFYKPSELDKQTPHPQAEIYIVASGNGTFENGSFEPVQFVKGDVLFVPAREEHRFVNFSKDFATWVIFYGQPMEKP